MMKLYVFHGGGDYADKCLNDPFDPDVGQKVYLPWLSFLIMHPKGNVLFDSGIDPAMFVGDLRAQFGDWADALDYRFSEGDDIVSRLAALGLTPKDIDIVVMSHLHFDHAMGLPLFLHARIIVQRAEMAFARHPPVYQAGTYFPRYFAGDHKWELLDGPHDIFGDGRLELFPTPGHTPGSQSLMFRGDESRVMLIGDATYSLKKMRERKLPGFLWNPDHVVASWEFIEWMEKKENAILLSTHDEDFQTRLRLAPDAFYS